MAISFLEFTKINASFNEARTCVLIIANETRLIGSATHVLYPVAVQNLLTHQLCFKGEQIATPYIPEPSETMYTIFSLRINAQLNRNNWYPRE